MVGRRRNNKKKQGGRADALKKGTSTVQATSSEDNVDVSPEMMDVLDLSDIKETEDMFAEEMDKELSLAIADIFENEYSDELGDIISGSDELGFADTKNIITDTSVPASADTKSKETNQTTKKKLDDDKPSVSSTQSVMDKEMTESMATECDNSVEKNSSVSQSVNTEELIVKESELSQLDLFPKISVTGVEKIEKEDSLNSQVIDREQENKNLGHCEEPSLLVDPNSSVEAGLSIEETIQDTCKTESQELIVENSDSVSEAALSMSASTDIDNKSLSNTSLVFSTTYSVGTKCLGNILEKNVSESNPFVMEGDQFEDKEVKPSSNDFHADKCNIIVSLEDLETSKERSGSVDVKSVETSEKHAMNEMSHESGYENHDRIKAVSNAEAEDKNDTVCTETVEQTSGNQSDKKLTSMNDEESIGELELGDDELAELIEKELTEIVKNDSVDELCKETDSKSAQLLHDQKYEETKLNGLFRGSCHLENELKNTLSPLIGLEYVVEVWQLKWEKFKFFECILCKQKLNDKTLVQHLTDSLHRVLYLEKHLPKYEEKFPGENPKKWNTKITKALEDLCEQLEKCYGRQKVYVTTSRYFSKFTADIKHAIQEGLHFSESEKISLPSELLLAETGQEEKSSNSSQVLSELQGTKEDSKSTTVDKNSTDSKITNSLKEPEGVSGSDFQEKNKSVINSSSDSRKEPESRDTEEYFENSSKLLKDKVSTREFLKEQSNVQKKENEKEQQNWKAVKTDSATETNDFQGDGKLFVHENQESFSTFTGPKNKEQNKGIIQSNRELQKKGVYKEDDQMNKNASQSKQDHQQQNKDASEIDTLQKGVTKDIYQSVGDQQKENKNDPSVFAENQEKERINDVSRSDKNLFKDERSNTEPKSDVDQPKEKNKDGLKSVKDKENVEKIKGSSRKTSIQHREQDEINKDAKNDMKHCEKDVRQGQITGNSRREKKDLPWQHDRNDRSRENRDRYQFQMKRRNHSKEDSPAKRRRNRSPASVNKPEEMSKDFNITKKQSDFQRGNDYRSACSDSKVSEGYKGELSEKIANQINQRGKHLRNWQDRQSFRLGRTEDSFSSPLKMGQFDKGEKLSVNASGLPNRSNMSTMNKNQPISDRRTNVWEEGDNSKNYEDIEITKRRRETNHFSNIGVTSLQQFEDTRLMQLHRKGILGSYASASGLLQNKEHNVGTSMHLSRKDIAHSINSPQSSGRKRPSQMAKNVVPKKLQASQMKARTELQSFSTPNIGSFNQSGYSFDNLSVNDYSGANKEEIANHLASALTEKGMTDIPDHRLVSFLRELGYMNQNNPISNAMSYTGVEMNADESSFYRNTPHWQKNFVSQNNRDISGISQRKKTFSELGMTSLNDSTKQHFGVRAQTCLNPESNSAIESMQLSSTSRDSGNIYRMPTSKIQTRNQQNPRQSQKQPKQQKRDLKQKGQNIKASQCQRSEPPKSLEDEDVSYSKTNEEQFVKGNFEIAREMLPLQFGKCQDSQTGTLYRHSQRKRRSKKLSKESYRQSGKASGSPKENTERKTNVTSTNNEELYTAERNQNVRLLEEKLPSQFGKNQSGQKRLLHKQPQQTKIFQNYPRDKSNQNPQHLGLLKAFKDSEMTTSGAVTVNEGQLARVGARKSRFSENVLPSNFGENQNVQARALYRQSQWKKGKFENDFRPSADSTEQTSSLLSSNYEGLFAGRSGNQNLRVIEDMSPSRFENNQRAQTRMLYAQPKQKNEMHTNFPESKTDPSSRNFGYKIEEHLDGKSSETASFYKGQFARGGDYNSRFSESLLTSRFEKNENNQIGGLYRQSELKQGILPNPQGVYRQSELKASENNSNQSHQSSRSLKRENILRQPTNLTTMVEEGLFRGRQNEKKVPEEKLSPQFGKYPRDQNRNQYRQYEQKSGILQNNQEFSQNTRSFGPSRFEKNRSGITSGRTNTNQGQSTWERIQNLASSKDMLPMQAGKNSCSQIRKFAEKEGNFQSNLADRPKPHSQSYGLSKYDDNLLDTTNVTSGFYQKQFEGRRIMNSKSQELMSLQFEDSQRESVGGMYRYSDLKEGNFHIPPDGRSNQGRKNFGTSQKVYQQESNLDDSKVNDQKRSFERQINRSGGSLPYQKNTCNPTLLYPLMKTGIVQYPLRVGISRQNYMKDQTQQNSPFGIHKEDTKRRWDGISKEGKRTNSQKGSYGQTSQN